MANKGLEIKYADGGANRIELRVVVSKNFLGKPTRKALETIKDYSLMCDQCVLQDGACTSFFSRGTAYVDTCFNGSAMAVLEEVRAPCLNNGYKLVTNGI